MAALHYRLSEDFVASDVVRRYLTQTSQNLRDMLIVLL
jgi:hypothetical protein